MWTVSRCKRNISHNYLITIFVVILILIISFQNFVFHHERIKWLEMKQRFESMITERETETHPNQSTRLGIDDATKPIIYVITPTFARPVQKAELTRLLQTFLHVPNLHWLIVEDALKKTDMVSNLLSHSTIKYTHLVASTPVNYKLGKNDPNWKKPRGVEQRNKALKWLRDNPKSSRPGIIYFADDDNTYSVELFREMNQIKTVGVWPVGLVGGLMVEKPFCDNVTGKVTGFNAVWKPDRPFPLDMAGFAINLELILRRKGAWFSYNIQSGYQESEILRQMVTRDELQPLANHCTKVYVWHTRTEPPQLNAEQVLRRKGKHSDSGIEV